MLENIELGSSLKHDFKVMSTKENKYMKDLIIVEARNILDNDLTVPILERETHYTSLIVDIPTSLKDEIKIYCRDEEIKIRDFWVECVKLSMRRYNVE